MSDREHLDPAKTIIARLGGIKIVAEITGRDKSRVSRWMYPVERGGTGGLIPQREAVKLLQYAENHGVRLKAADFLQPPTPARAAS